MSIPTNEMAPAAANNGGHNSNNFDTKIISFKQDNIKSFCDAIRSAGMTPPHSIWPGKMHRFPGVGKKSSNSAGWCKLFSHGRAGVFGDFSTGLSEKWLASSNGGNKLTEADRIQLRKECDAAAAEAAAELEKDRAKARERAEAIWSGATPCLQHDYLTRKGVKSHGLKLYEGKLVISIFDAYDRLHSLQFIAEDGNKRFLKGGQTLGCYFTLGEPANVLCICEGYATAASIHEATGYAVAVAFSAGNLLPVAKALRNKYPNSKLIICADADENRVGESKAREVAKAVDGIVVLPTFGPDQSSGLTDFNDLHKQAGLEAVKEQINHGRDSQDSQGVEPQLCHPDSQDSQDSQGVHVISEPEPLRRPMPSPEPYPLGALGPILGGAALRIHSVIGAPAAMVGQSLLAAASLAAQHLADVEIDGRREPISLWCMTVGVSGERKSAVDTQVLQPHREFERTALDKYKCEKQEFDTSSIAYETIKRSVTNGKGKAIDVDLIEHELRNIGNPPEPPLKPFLLIGSPTIEGIHKQFIGGLPSLGLFNDDAGEFLGGHSMSSENRTKTASGLSRLWDCGEFDRIRAGDGAEKHYGKRLALHLMLQPVIAETVLSDDLLVGQGFLARCLLTWPASTIGTRPYVEANLAQAPEVVRYNSRIDQLLTIQPQLRQGSRNELQPRTLTMDADAKNTWKDIYLAIERDLSDSGPWATVRAWASKAPAQVLRIAAVLSLVESPNTGVIRADAIERAGLLVNHYLSEAVRILGTSSVPAPIRHAEQLLEWCHSTGREYLCSSEALQYGPNVIRTNQALKSAVAELERTGWARRIEHGMEIGEKHRKNVWKIEGKR